MIQICDFITTIFEHFRFEFLASTIMSYVCLPLGLPLYTKQESQRFLGPSVFCLIPESNVINLSFE